MNEKSLARQMCKLQVLRQGCMKKIPLWKFRRHVVGAQRMGTPTFEPTVCQALGKASWRSGHGPSDEGPSQKGTGLSKGSELGSSWARSGSGAPVQPQAPGDQKPGAGLRSRQESGLHLEEDGASAGLEESACHSAVFQRVVPGNAAAELLPPDLGLAAVRAQQCPLCLLRKHQLHTAQRQLGEP